MLRHVVRTAAERAGWDKERICASVMGHGEGEDPCLLLVPVPSIEPRRDGAETVGAVRRVMVYSTHTRSSDVVWAERVLGGMALIDEKTGEVQAVLAATSRKDNVLKRYVSESAVWATVTPVASNEATGGPSREQVLVPSIASIPRSLQELMQPSGRSRGTKFSYASWKPGLLEMLVKSPATFFLSSRKPHCFSRPIRFGRNRWPVRSISKAMTRSALHEAMVRLFRDRPQFVEEVLHKLLDLRLPKHREVRVESGEFSQVAPPEYHADFVVSLFDERAVMGIIVEVQLSRVSQKKLSWPLYAANLRARLGCPVCLVVVTPRSKVATWARKPIETGPGNYFHPVVLGPELIPAIEDVEAAQRAPELAVLSAIAHGEHPRDPEQAARVAVAALSACVRLDDERAVLYNDVVRSSLGEAARNALEALMQSERYEFQSEFARKYVALGRDEGRAEGEAKGRAEGKAEGKAEGVLRVLARRQIPVSDEQRARVLACSDIEQLDLWLDMAITAQSTEELFA